MHISRELKGDASNKMGEINLSNIQARVQVTVPVVSLLPERPEHEIDDNGEAAEDTRLEESGRRDAERRRSGGQPGGAARDESTGCTGYAGYTEGSGAIGTVRPGRYSRVAGLQGAATLAGYGSIDTPTARLLTGSQAGWVRILCRRHHVMKHHHGCGDGAIVHGYDQVALHTASQAHPRGFLQGAIQSD